jgi:TPR repeat protein
MLSEKDPNKVQQVVRVYNEFLDKNPKDHRKVPEACYSLAECYLKLNDLKEAQVWYEKGLIAELPENRLPGLASVSDLPSKMIMSMMFSPGMRKK